jgi:hypothetical protein
MNTRHFTLLVTASLLLPSFGLAWGEPHLAITKAALEVLPAWQKEVLGAEFAPLGENYCLIPDHVHTDKENAKFAMMDSRPGEIYVRKLHLPVPEQIENLDTLRYFMERAVTALQEGKVGDSARYMGTICHIVEDFGSPSHTIPGDNMFTLLQQFMPPTEKMNGKLLHGPIENGTFAVSIAGYTPRLLGVTLEEASWRLLHRVHEGIINARGTTIPIIQALYADDAATVTKWQLKAAVMDAQVLCDALHTILCLGTGKIEAGPRETLQHVDISTYWPVEAVNLYYPQTHFFSSPYWGHACSGFILEEGTRPVPLKLRVQQKDGAVVEKTFVNGISTGMGKPLTWHVPKGVYQRFTVRAGLQAGLGDKGRVEFSIAGDGKALATATVNGTEPAHVFECDISGVSQIQLIATGRGLDAKSNYAVWAEPVLVKAMDD